MALDELIRQLEARAPRGAVFGLERMRAALGALGDPHRAYPAVHVAGSNGKGSTCAMVEAIARAAGLRTGLNTSPHLSRFAERIRFGGVPIEDGPFERALETVVTRCASDLTFFETMTLVAFQAFADANIELAIVEVGLGGRLDATNVLESPVATAVTTISLEHTNLLGDTLGAIAREKAGIFKAASPVVLGPLPSEAEVAASEIARAVGAGPTTRVRQVETASESVSAGFIDVARAVDGTVDIATRTRSFAVRPALDGAHQASNAAIAVGLAGGLERAFPSRDWASAIPLGVSQARWPGRLERIAYEGRTLLFDCAHNIEGANALVAALARERQAVETSLVFGALADKSWSAMLTMLAPLAKRRHYTAPKGRPAAPLEALTAIAEGTRDPEPTDALARAIALSPPGATILVTGSIYLVGELRAHVAGTRADAFIAL